MAADGPHRDLTFANSVYSLRTHMSGSDAHVGGERVAAADDFLPARPMRRAVL